MQTYDLQKMQNLLKDLYTLTNIKICIYDSNENELCFYPKKLSAFCELLRSNPDMEERCLSCDKRAFAECKKTRKQHLYTCHAGLIECVSPIIFNETIIGYIAVGQIKSMTNAQIPEEILNSNENSREKLRERFEELPIVDMQKFNSAINIMDACTGYEYLKSLVSSTIVKIDTRVSNYIDSHLKEDLSVAKLCSVFHLSHTEIYSIFKDYFNLTPAEYVKKRRLSRACKYLKETNYQVNKIAILCGIPDYNYFSKTFKKVLGISPKEYRKKPSN